MENRDSRYSRHLLLSEFSEESQKLLAQSRVVVIGAGGLGSVVLPYLCGSGVGEILVVDSDPLEEQNLHRQILYREPDVGINKALAAKNKLVYLNRESKITVIGEALTAVNIEQVMKYKFDLAIDCTDNFQVRYLLADWCWKYKIRLVTAAVLRWEGHLMSIIPDDTHPCLRCLMPKPPKNVPKASDVGVYGPAVGVLGCLQATEVIKQLAGLPGTLNRKLLTYDCLNNRSTLISRDKKPGCVCSTSEQ